MPKIFTHLTRHVAVICWLANAWAVHADEPKTADPQGTAAAYLQAIATNDWAGMKAYLAPKARYLDRTMAYFDRPIIDLEGPNAIETFWRTSGEGAGTEEIRFDIRKSYVAGDSVLIVLDVTVRNKGDAWGYPGASFTVNFPQVVHLRIRDERIELHEDLVDYDPAGDQIEQQIAELKSTGRASSESPDLNFSNLTPEAQIWRIADPYLRAVRAEEWDQMKALLAPDARYHDPTMDLFDRGPIELQGNQAIVDFWRGEAEKAQVQEHTFELEHRFIAGHVAVILGTEHLTTTGAVWGLDRPEVTVSSHHVIVLEIRDGHVVDHADFVDYGAIMSQVASMSE